MKFSLQVFLLLSTFFIINSMTVHYDDGFKTTSQEPNEESKISVSNPDKLQVEVIVIFVLLAILIILLIVASLLIFNYIRTKRQTAMLNKNNSSVHTVNENESSHIRITRGL